MSFVHLHVHSTYSLLDGFSDLKKLVGTVKTMGMNAVALTDHGTMFGTIEFYNAAASQGIKPIIGLETYMAARKMTDRDAKLDKHSSHLLLLAENEIGYRNLLQIASAAQLDGFYYFPRIDHEFLAKHSQGLIATSGCMAAEIPRAVMTGETEAIRRKMDWYYEVFGPDNFFLELQQHNIQELPAINKTLLEFGPRYAARFVATNDVHYVDPSDARLQDVLLAVQTGSLLNTPNRFKMEDQSYYLRSPAEMGRLFKEVPEALSNTQLIADRCSVDLEKKGYHLPVFEVPTGFDTQRYLRHLCEEGLIHRYGPRAKDPQVRERLEYELDIIHKMGFDAYFLIVWDLCRYARQEGVWYNARGSAAGSMIAYTLDITLVEPLDHGLIFERFLNPGRIEMPDIDLDFQDDMRANIMQYCASKYGDEKVAQIITFGTMGARGALRDVARVMDIPISEVDRVAKLVPNAPNHTLTLLDAVRDVPDLQEAYQTNPTIKEMIDTAAGMEGTVRSAGTHAAGVIISDRPIVEYAPLHRPTSGSEVTPIKQVMQYEMSHVDKLGLLKVDFLGLATLTIMAKACKLIQERHGILYDLNNIPTDDPETYQFIGRGHTAGVFQLEGTGMTRWLVQMKPTSLANVIAMVALFRPGPMEFIPAYIKRMHGEEEVKYIHPALEPIMKETFGIAVYQEQVMSAAIELAGFTAPEADNLRKAISKKNAEALEKNRKKFVEGASQRGIPAEIARAIFEDWENFARYGFNKSHAADYGVIAVKTAFLKCHYTVEYMTALLSANKNDTAKIAEYAADARSMNIAVLPPEINSSGWDFTIEDSSSGQSAIRFGLGAVKNVGSAPVEEFLKSRANGPFRDLTDLALRVDLRLVGKRALECLVKVGALDQFGSRLSILHALDRILSVSSGHFRAQQAGQMSFFGAAEGVTEEIHLPPAPEIDRRELLSWEKELIGLYVSSHPLAPFTGYFQAKTSHTTNQLKDLTSKENAIVGGMVTRLRSLVTKTGKPMAFAGLEDYQGEVEVILFPKVWEQVNRSLKVDDIYLVEGKVDSDGTTAKILADKLTRVTVEEAARYPAGTVPTISPPPMRVESPDELRSVAQPEQNLEDRVEEDPFWHDITFSEYAVGDHPSENVLAQSTPAENSASSPIALFSSTDVGEASLPLPPPILDLVSPPSGGSQQMLTILLRGSGDQEKDIRKMKRVQGILLSFSGVDHFAFHIFDKKSRCLIEFPNHSTKICPDLMDQLGRLVGSENLSVETITIQ